MIFRVLGPQTGPRKPATLLATLLLHANAWVSLDELIDEIWQEQAVPVSAERNVRTYVWQVRRVVPEGRIDARPRSYRLRVAPGEVDADVARALLDRSAGVAAPEAVGCLTAALELWRGTPYAELRAETAVAATAWLRELRWELRERLADAYTALGRHGEAIAVLRALTAEDPLREGTWARLVRALHVAGRRATALSEYRRVCDFLAAELGVEPGPELVRARREVAA
ncbi:AfsR/SARP family transcriptional regulator [Saccharothrix sp. S26]|uniref:AfsR/SARP family transcriptional regulator n=1 Tax=Saccharothrix sp. S26 TaxID=2907215 RepID=UPI001F3CE70E|nr:AfsR/SARP family transcriptional regulator [Saccharothrix sp. S26]MCE6996024.1 AfsR/SARP family transcriptional regulator [Saccharothrix sp. S26]